MSLSKRKAPVALPGVGKGKLKLEQPLETGRTIGDVPPEVLTLILEYLTIDDNRNTMLNYRRVERRWKDIVDSLLEKKLVSGKFQIFPVMKVEGHRQRSEFLHVRCSPTMFRAGGNSFPTNSLILSGYPNRKVNYLREGPADTQMALPVFISSFGENLTTFGLANRVIDFNTLVGMLGSMPNLKVVSFKNVKLPNEIVKPEDVLPTPPPLPNLRIIEAKSTGAKDEKGNILYVWLIASYADQLVSLTLGTKDGFPPLQQRHHYVHPLSRRVLIATTSNAAFGKLKELKLFHPTGDFLNRSRFPVLEHLSIAGLAKQRDVHLGTLIQFIVKCGGTLGKLTLDVIWDELLRGDFRAKMLPRHPGVETSRIKMLVIRYPTKSLHEIALHHKLLNLFPGLEVLQLLHFSSNESPVTVTATNFDNERKKRKKSNHREGYEFATNSPRYAELSEDLTNVKTADRRTRAAIFKRMAALGENVGEVLVREMLDRNRVWNNLPNLKIVSVSSGSESDGDVCLIHRADGNGA